MTPTYAWNFGPVEGRDKNGMTGVAETIHWQVTGEDEDGNTGRCIGTIRLNDPNPKTFKPLEESDQDDRRAWVEDADPELIETQEAIIDTQIQQKIDEAAASVFLVD